MIYLAISKINAQTLNTRRGFLRAAMASSVLSGMMKHSGHGSDLTGVPANRKAVIQIWLGGGPSHLDTYDMKPDAPDSFRGPFRPRSTNVPGLLICEHLPLQARRMDRLAVLRSLHHGTHSHHSAIHWHQTGFFGATDESPEPTRPSVGSVVAAACGATHRGMTPYVHIAPDPLSAPYYMRSFGPAYLGARFQPLNIESKRAGADGHGRDDYFRDLTRKPQFRLPCLDLLPDLSPDRLQDRATLMRLLDVNLRRLARNSDGLDDLQRQALGLLLHSKARAAFDLSREPAAVRERYGMNSWGQGALLCRRLVEAGSACVTLNTDSYALAWDSHANLERDLKKMLPVYDRMLVALIDDLIDRGMWNHVVLVVRGEFGGTPRMGDRTSTNAMNNNTGRDHYAKAGFTILGGGGIRGGTMIGRTSSKGEEPVDRPLTPADVLATIYHVLGVDTSQEYPDRLGRPLPILSGAEAIKELLTSSGTG